MLVALLHASRRENRARHCGPARVDRFELAMTALQRQRLDPMMRKELASLLKLLINECGATLAKTKEADDE
jgi:hypothetical protein